MPSWRQRPRAAAPWSRRARSASRPPPASSSSRRSTRCSRSHGLRSDPGRRLGPARRARPSSLLVARRRGLRAALAGRTSSAPRPRPRAGRLLLPALHPRHRTVHDAAQRRQRRHPARPCLVAAGDLDGALAALDRRRRHAAGHGPVQLAGPLGRSPHRRAVAHPRPAPLPGRAERPHLVPCPPAHAHERVPARHRSRPPAHRRPPAGARPHHGLRLPRYPPAHQRPLVLRAAGPRLREPGATTGCTTRSTAART